MCTAHYHGQLKYMAGLEASHFVKLPPFGWNLESRPLGRQHLSSCTDHPLLVSTTSCVRGRSHPQGPVSPVIQGKVKIHQLISEVHAISMSDSYAALTSLLFKSHFLSSAFFPESYFSAFRFNSHDFFTDGETELGGNMNQFPKLSEPS